VIVGLEARAVPLVPGREREMEELSDWKTLFYWTSLVVAWLFDVGAALLLASCWRRARPHARLRWAAAIGVHAIALVVVPFMLELGASDELVRFGAENMVPVVVNAAARAVGLLMLASAFALLLCVLGAARQVRSSPVNGN
jgi:hypothetical protein